ncbi:MAG: helix-turn-helix domain-containing protein [Bdellovibrio sp.]|nr:helix-turn-helix domain-containing protein [Bdellovibrio sp.]
MKKLNQKSFDYPIVIRRVANDLVFSIPDIGYFKHIPLQSEKASTDSSKSSISSKPSKSAILSEDLIHAAAEQLENAWIHIDKHLENKKWLPDASTFKQSLQKAEEDYSLPEFVVKLKEHMSVSENTVRREIKRGQIQCYQTEGGHRRIPCSELGHYLEKCKTKRADADL